jgi:hypothetical protein
MPGVVRLTKCSRQSSTAINGGECKHEIAGWLLFPAFSTINGGAFIPSVYPSPPNTPTAVCIVLVKVSSVIIYDKDFGELKHAKPPNFHHRM